MRAVASLRDVPMKVPMPDFGEGGSRRFRTKPHGAAGTRLEPREVPKGKSPHESPHALDGLPRFWRRRTLYLRKHCYRNIAQTRRLQPSKLTTRVRFPSPAPCDYASLSSERLFVWDVCAKIHELVVTPYPAPACCIIPYNTPCEGYYTPRRQMLAKERFNSMVARPFVRFAYASEEFARVERSCSYFS